MLLRIIIIILEGAKCNKNLWDHAAVSPTVTLTAGCMRGPVYHAAVSPASPAVILSPACMRGPVHHATVSPASPAVTLTSM